MVPSTVPVPAGGLTITVAVLLPFSGRAVPFVAPCAAAGLRAATASIKLERKISLRGLIPVTPCLGPRASCVLANGAPTEPRAAVTL